MKQKEAPEEKLLDRLRKFPPAAIAGAFASFAEAAGKPAGEVHTRSTPSVANSPVVPASQKASGAIPGLPQEYALETVLVGVDARRSLSRSLSGLAIDSADRVYVLGDGKVDIIDRNGETVKSWRAPEGAACIAVGSDERVYLGVAGKVEMFTGSGVRVGAFTVGDGRDAKITSIKISGGEVLVADASARFIRKFDKSGSQVGEIGTQNKTHGFMLPNRALDFAVDSTGILRATDSGRHRVSSWTLDGKPAGDFGKFGLSKPEDFVGCCNPVNIAIAPDGRVVTAEKVSARVKVYDGSGKLLALIGSEYFDPAFVHLHLAVDSRGRIIVGDPVRREIKIFSAVVRAGGHGHV